MSPNIGNRKNYVVAKLAVRKLTRTIRDIRKQLLVETNPIDYYRALADAATAEAQLDDYCVQIGEWEMRGGCLGVPQQGWWRATRQRFPR